MPLNVHNLICSSSWQLYQLVLLDGFYANMDLENVSNSWCYCRQLCLVAISTFQVKIHVSPFIINNHIPFCCRLEGEAYVHYKSMLISLALHLILLMFELLVCNKLESSKHLWILVFIPLIFISIVSIAVCIWAVKHDRSFEV